MARVLIFDSGVGGLSVLEEIRKGAPDLAVTCVLDNAFFPYGNRTGPELVGRLPGLLAGLCEVHDPDVVVVACNTASTVALEHIRAALQVPVVGTVPAIKPAALKTRTGVIGLLGTPGTVERQYTGELIADHAPDVYVIRHGSARLVALAEARLRGQQLNFTELKGILENLTNHRRGHEMDILVLACTHFALVRDEIAHLLSPDITIIDSGEAIARRTINQLNLLGAMKQGGMKQGGRAGNKADGDDVVVFTKEDGDLEALGPALKALGMERIEYLEH